MDVLSIVAKPRSFFEENVFVALGGAMIGGASGYGSAKGGGDVALDAAFGAGTGAAASIGLKACAEALLRHYGYGCKDGAEPGRFFVYLDRLPAELRRRIDRFDIEASRTHG